MLFLLLFSIFVEDMNTRIREYETSLSSCLLVFLSYFYIYAREGGRYPPPKAALSFFELTIIIFMFSVLQRYEEFPTPARAKMVADKDFVNLVTVFVNFASRG